MQMKDKIGAMLAINTNRLSRNKWLSERSVVRKYSSYLKIHGELKCTQPGSLDWRKFRFRFEYVRQYQSAVGIEWLELYIENWWVERD